MKELALKSWQDEERSWKKKLWVKFWGASPEDFGKLVTMFASEAEWIICQRRAIQALCRIENLTKLVPLSQDPPSASASTYMSIYVKLCELASQQTNRPVGAPMFREWITALEGQWTYTEPPVSPGATWGEAIDKSDVLQTPYRCVIQGDSTH